MSEVDVNGEVLRSFTDVSWPRHLSLDSEGRVLVADSSRDRILLLSSELQLQRVLIATNSQVELWRPEGLCYNELTSQLYVAHSSEEVQSFAEPLQRSLLSLLSLPLLYGAHNSSMGPLSDVISVFRLQ